MHAPRGVAPTALPPRQRHTPSALTRDTEPHTLVRAACRRRPRPSSRQSSHGANAQTTQDAASSVSRRGHERNGTDPVSLNEYPTHNRHAWRLTADYAQPAGPCPVKTRCSQPHVAAPLVSIDSQIRPKQTPKHSQPRAPHQMPSCMSATRSGSMGPSTSPYGMYNPYARRAHREALDGHQAGRNPRKAALCAVARRQRRRRGCACVRAGAPCPCEPPCAACNGANKRAP